jgi:hypothetical protein
LEAIPEAAFSACESLTSIFVPSSVKTMGTKCFAHCGELRYSPLPVDSQVVRLGIEAFWVCSALKSMFLPPTVEIVDEECFGGCDSLANLIFGSPSHLRELLSLPPGLSGLVTIPDSVEILRFGEDFESRDPPILAFGPDSR